MMGTTHHRMGIAAGAGVAWALRLVVLPAPPPALLVVASVVASVLLTQLAGNAAWWPDLDHESATAARSGGLITEVLSTFVHDLSCYVFDLIATDADRKAGDFRGHRGLTHWCVTAVLIAGALGSGVWWVTVDRPGFVLGVLLAWLMWMSIKLIIKIDLIRRQTRRRLEWARVLVCPLLVVTLSLWVPLPATVDWSLVGIALGTGVGLAVFTGMVTHDLGDAATLAGVPFWAPLKIKGQRYYPVHIRPKERLTKTGKDSPVERRFRLCSWILFGLFVVGWVPGLWDTLWELIPWPSNM
jgi:membrane-bound metal-dependent hydrolase YbcI (DUF457 family)